jgi:hypothetical protein
MDHRPDDLTDMVVVLPTRRAGRNFDAALMAVATERGSNILSAPRVTTASGLVDLVLEEPSAMPAGRMLDELEVRLAWAAVLRSAETDVLEPLLGRSPTAGDAGAWWRIAETIARLRRELSSVRMTLTSLREKATPLDPNELRWAALAALEAAYSDRLVSRGELDRESARATALAKLDQLGGDRGSGKLPPVALVGLADLTLLERATFRHAASVDALVLADESHSAGFDDDGGLVTEWWSGHGVPLENDQLHWVGRSPDEPRVAAGLIASLARGRSEDEVSVGVGDEATGPAVVEAITLAGGSARWAVGRPLSEPGPAELVRGVGQFWSRGRLSDLGDDRLGAGV